MWWLAAPLVVLVGKKIYDAVTEDETQGTYTRSDNSEAQEKKAQKAQQKEEKQKRTKRLTNQLYKFSLGELEALQKSYLSTPKKFTINDVAKLKTFGEATVSGTPSAKNALSVLTDEAVVVLFEQKSLREKELVEQLAVLTNMEALLKKVGK